MPKLETKPLSWFKPDPNQPRKYFDEEELRLLGKSLRVRQLQPVVARSNGVLLAGGRRFRAAQLEGLETLLVIVTDEALSDSQIRQLQLVENMLRADLSGYEQWMACAELMCMNPSWQIKDLTEHLNLNTSTGTRILSPSKCIEAVQDALKDGKIGISDAYAISKLPHSGQAGLLALKLSGASRDKLEEAGRKIRARKVDAVKLARVVCSLAGGVKVTVAGNAMDLEGLIEALQSTLEAARKANRDGLDVRTMERVLRDKAKAG